MAKTMQVRVPTPHPATGRGMLVFGDVPDVITIIGMAIVMAGGRLVATSPQVTGRPGM
jgi:hypothetical protein